jgi:hypothetical protein
MTKTLNDPSIPGDWHGSSVVDSSVSCLPHATHIETLRAVAGMIRSGLTVTRIAAEDPTGTPKATWVRIMAVRKGHDRAACRAAAREALRHWTQETKKKTTTTKSIGEERALLLAATNTGTPEQREEARRALYRLSGGHRAYVDAVLPSATALALRTRVEGGPVAPSAPEGQRERTYRIEAGDDLGAMPVALERSGLTHAQVSTWLDQHVDVGTFLIVDEHDGQPACLYPWGLAGGAQACDCGRPECLDNEPEQS